MNNFRRSEQPLPSKAMADDELKALLDEFVLYTDNTPESNEPTELSVFLKSCGFEGVMERLHDELRDFIQARDEQREIDIRIDELGQLPRAGFVGENGIRFEAVLHSQVDNRLAELKSKRKGS